MDHTEKQISDLRDTAQAARRSPMAAIQRIPIIIDNAIDLLSDFHKRIKALEGRDNGQ